jgi:hypothetical protein
MTKEEATRSQAALDAINMRTSERLDFLAPNRGCDRTVEDNWSYSMPLQTVVVDRPADIRVFHSPDNDMRPHHLVMNVTEENTFFLNEFIVGNQLKIKGPLDACVYGSIRERERGAVCTQCGAPPTEGLEALHCKHCGAMYPVGTKNYGKEIECPVIRPSTRVSFSLRYTGRRFGKYAVGDEFNLSIVLVGWRVI